MDISNKIWAEKYRPKNFDTYIFPADGELERKACGWLKEGIFPNLVLAGIQGTGKSSLARVLIHEFDVDEADFMFIDGSVHNKIDDVRNKIVANANIAPMGDFKVIVIEEAHRLTRDSQSALYETVERNSGHLRFIFTTNYPKKIDAPLLSRCQTFMFNDFNEDGVFELISRIIEEENIELDDDEIEILESHITTHKPDLRAIVSSIQYSYVDGKLQPPTGSMKSSSLADWTEEWSKETADLNIDTLYEAVYSVDATNYDNFYIAIYQNGLHHFPDKGEAIVHISEYLARASNGSTQGIQSIHLEALLHVLFNYTDGE